jgi:AcrR family transcriptional regulator
MSDPPPQTALRGKQATRRRVLDCAHRLFNEHGYDGATIRMIAEAAAVAPASVLETFPSKRDLFIALMEENQTMRVERTQAAFEANKADLPQAILATFRAARAFDVERGIRFVRETVALSFRDPKSLNPKIQAIVWGFYAPMLEAISAEQAAGRFRADVSPGRAIMALSALHFELLKLEGISGAPELDYDEEMREAMGIWLRGLQA